MHKDTVWKMVAAVELVVAAAVIIMDLFVPTLVILGICAVSLLVRRQGLRSIGFKRPGRPLRMVAIVLLIAVVWTVLTFSVTTPVLNHLTGTTRDVSTFEDLKGNVASLVFLLLASWTLAALGEEIVYRGYLQARVGNIFGSGLPGIVAAVGITSVLFGVAHLEQGVVGVALTFIDAIFFSLVKLRFDNNLWAAVLAHGFVNSIGVVTFFFVGPVSGLW